VISCSMTTLAQVVLINHDLVSLTCSVREESCSRMLLRLRTDVTCDDAGRCCSERRNGCPGLVEGQGGAFSDGMRDGIRGTTIGSLGSENFVVGVVVICTH
jgi:hypothetical protein